MQTFITFFGFLFILAGLFAFINAIFFTTGPMIGMGIFAGCVFMFIGWACLRETRAIR